MSDIAARVRQALDEYAARQSARGWSSLDLARIADLTGTDVHWLITGERDEQVKIIACCRRVARTPQEAQAFSEDDLEAVQAEGRER